MLLIMIMKIKAAIKIILYSSFWKLFVILNEWSDGV